MALTARQTCKGRVKLIACDMPTATRLTVGIMAPVAEEEARAISARTKVALAAAKVDGTLGAQARRDIVDSFAAGLAPVLCPMRDEGL